MSNQQQNKGSTEDYNKKSREIFRLLNEFRKNPKILIKYLENLKKYIDNKNILSEPNKIPVQMPAWKMSGKTRLRFVLQALLSELSSAP